MSLNHFTTGGSAAPLEQRFTIIRVNDVTGFMIIAVKTCADRQAQGEQRLSHLELVGLLDDDLQLDVVAQRGPAHLGDAPLLLILPRQRLLFLLLLLLLLLWRKKKSHKQRGDRRTREERGSGVRRAIQGLNRKWQVEERND